MHWKFWKRKKSDEIELEVHGGQRKTSMLELLPSAYARQQLIFLQRMVGNQAVLRWTGLQSKYVKANAGSDRAHLN
jgi:hypothetical protein